MIARDPARVLIVRPSTVGRDRLADIRHADVTTVVARALQIVRREAAIQVVVFGPGGDGRASLHFVGLVLFVQAADLRPHDSGFGWPGPGHAFAFVVITTGARPFVLWFAGGQSCWRLDRRTRVRLDELEHHECASCACAASFTRARPDPYTRSAQRWLAHTGQSAPHQRFHRTDQAA